MDIGVGSFIFSSGVISGKRLVLDSEDRISALMKAVKTSIPLLLLGLLRYFMTRAANYQVFKTLEFIFLLRNIANY